MRAPQPGMRRNAPTSSHSFRCTDPVWKKAKERAEQDGVPINYVIEQFITGYAHGMLKLPKVKVQYVQPNES